MFKFLKRNGTEKRTIDFNSVFGTSKPNTKSGVPVNAESSLGLTAVYSAVDQISNSVAKLPIRVYRRQGESSIEQPNHPVAKLLNKPNPFINRYDFFKTLEVHRQLYGNAYCWIDREGNKPVALWILPPNEVGINKSVDGKSLIYYISINGKAYQVPHTDILHIKRMSLDGYSGNNPIYTSREVIGIANASNQFLGGYYSNGTTTRDVVTYPTKLGNTAKDAIRSEWQKFNSGLENAHKIGILDLGMDVKQLDKKIVDMDFMNTVKFYSVEEVARLFNMPPTMLGDLSKATFSNVENLNLLYYKNTISPLITSIEEECNFKLFIGEENLYCDFDMQEELRGDTAARVSYYKELQSMAVISPNEIRIKEGFAPVDSEAMNERYMSLNFSPIETIKQYQTKDVPNDINKSIKEEGYSM